MEKDSNITCSTQELTIKSDKKRLSKLTIILIITIIIFILLFLFFPKFKLNGKKEENIEAGMTYIDNGFSLTFLGKDISSKVRISGTVDTTHLGTYTLYYHMPYLPFPITRTVTVVDTTPPHISLNGEQYMHISYQTTFSEPGYLAQDNLDGDLTNKVIKTEQKISEKEKKIQYQVSDSSGNITTVERMITTIDNVKPTLTLKGNIALFLTVGDTYQEEGATANDEVDGDLTNKIQISGTVDTTTPGVYTILYQIRDTSQNEATATRKITVATKVVPQTQGSIYLTFDDGPSTTITPKILDVLKEHNVKATFFILNYNENTESIVKRIVAEGHSIAIHGYSHQYRQIYTSSEAFMENITKLQEKIKKSTGVTTKLLRFPGGSSNTVSKFNPRYYDKTYQRGIRKRISLF